MKKLKTALFRASVCLSMALATVCSVRPAYALSFSVNGTSGQVTIDPGEIPSLGGNNWQDMLGNVITKYKSLASIILGLCAITSLIALVVSIAKLGASTMDSAPMARRRATVSILVSGISLILFGGLTAVVGFFWNFLKAPI